MLRQTIVRALCATFLVLAAACGAPVNHVGGACTSDAACGEFETCDLANQLCLCTSNDACDSTEFCNIAGRCQPKDGCLTNDDCKTEEHPTAICDTAFGSSTRGQCLSLSTTVQCLQDAHCPFGFHCDGQECLPGCVDNGDCPLGQPCIGGGCNDTPGACNDVSYCEFGQLCVDNTCQNHPQIDTLCAQCNPSDFLGACIAHCLYDNSVYPTACGDDGDCTEGGHCIDDLPCSDGGQCPSGVCAGDFPFGTCAPYCGNFYCGSTSCGAGCPRGYECTDIVYTTDASCTRNGGECPSGRACSADAPGENNFSGYCLCTSDEHCPAGSCVNGACYEGNACVPASGLTCEDVR